MAWLTTSSGVHGFDDDRSEREKRAEVLGTSLNPGKKTIRADNVALAA